MVGPLPGSASARAELAGTVEITGPVSRSAIRDHYAWADVFFLPSICEGSATAVYEALTAALPVICTANTGSVVRDGVDGFIVPIRAVEVIAERIERLAADNDLRRFQSENARQRAAEYSLETYGACLLQLFGATIPLIDGSQPMRHKRDGRPLPACPAGEAVWLANRACVSPSLSDPCRLARQVKQFGWLPRLAPPSCPNCFTCRASRQGSEGVGGKPAAG